jgi:arylsulfatase A-like enzyme
MKPIRFLLCLALALTVFELSADTPSSRPLPRRANIILIVADGLGQGDLSCYGQTQFQTPNLDKLAASGVRFTNYSAGGLASSAALAALMTGKDTSHQPDASYTLASGDITVAQLLGNSGYSTGMIGEWDLGDQNSSGAPWEHGFQQFAGYFDPADVENVYADFIWRYEPRYDTNNQPNPFNGREMVYDNTGGQKGKYIPDWLTTLAVTYAKMYKPVRFNHYRPFFLALNFTIPGNGKREVPTDAPFSEEAWPQAEKNRAAMITRLDNDIGQLLENLDKTGQTKNTVIFFTSDTVPKKGGGTDPQFFHENASPDDLRVPMIVSLPGKFPAGQVCGLACSARDFLPTATAIGLVRPPEKVDGTSFLPALLGGAQK